MGELWTELTKQFPSIAEYAGFGSVVISAVAGMMRIRAIENRERSGLLLMARDLAPHIVVVTLWLLTISDLLAPSARLVILLIALLGTGANLGALYGVHYGWKLWWDRALRDVDVSVARAYWDIARQSVRVYVSLLNRSPLMRTLHAKPPPQGGLPTVMTLNLVIRGQLPLQLTEIKNSKHLLLPPGDRGRTEVTFEAQGPLPNLGLNPGVNVVEADLDVPLAGRPSLFYNNFQICVQ